MIILDTNVVSEMMKDDPEPDVVNWLIRQPRSLLWISTITVFEIQLGLNLMVAGSKQKLLLAAFEELLSTDLKGRVLPFDAAAANKASALIANRQKAGKPIESPADGLIGGIVLARKGTLATRNVKHFTGTGVKVVNPWA